MTHRTDQSYCDKCGLKKSSSQSALNHPHYPSEDEGIVETLTSSNEFRRAVVLSSVSPPEVNTEVQQQEEKQQPNDGHNGCTLSSSNPLAKSGIHQQLVQLLDGFIEEIQVQVRPPNSREWSSQPRVYAHGTVIQYASHNTARRHKFRHEFLLPSNVDYFRVTWCLEAQTEATIEGREPNAYGDHNQLIIHAPYCHPEFNHPRHSYMPQPQSSVGMCTQQSSELPSPIHSINRQYSNEVSANKSPTNIASGRPVRLINQHDCCNQSNKVFSSADSTPHLRCACEANRHTTRSLSPIYPVASYEEHELGVVEVQPQNIPHFDDSNIMSPNSDVLKAIPVDRQDEESLNASNFSLPLKIADQSAEYHLTEDGCELVEALDTDIDPDTIRVHVKRNKGKVWLTFAREVLQTQPVTDSNLLPKTYKVRTTSRREYKINPERFHIAKTQAKCSEGKITIKIPFANSRNNKQNE